MAASEARAYKNDKAEEFARWRRRDHANIEDIQNLVFEAVAEETGQAVPPRVRHFVSVLQGAHGGGEVINEPFARSHATVAERLNLKGSAEAKEQAVRRLINQLEDFQKRCGYRFFFVERGGQFVGRNPDGREVYTTTTYTDVLKPLADAGVMRARASELWRGNPEKGIKAHPGKALAAEVAWVLAQLPRVDAEPEAPAKESNVFSLADYAARREAAFVKSLEQYADGVDERGGDSAHYLERLEIEIVRLRASRLKTKRKQEAGDDERREQEKDAAVWEGYEAPKDARGDASTNTAYKSDALAPLPELLESLAHPPTNLTPPAESAGLATEAGPVDDREVLMVDWALWWAAGGFRVFPMHDVFDGICSCKCSPKKCKDGRHGCGDNCASPGKHSRVREWEKIATGDAEQITKWWAKWPHANIGGLMGGERRVIALDVDPKNGGDASLCDLVEAHGGEWLDTLHNQTGSLGGHYFFTYPEGLNLRNTAGVVAPGIDTRAGDGCVVLPPSLHFSGRRYELKNPTTIKPLPEFLLAYLAPSGEAPRAVVDFQEMRGRQTFAAGRGSGERFNNGERNSGLFGVGIGRWRHGWAKTEGDLLAQLAEVNAWRCSPPLEPEEVGALASHIARDYSHLCGIDAEGKGAA